MIATRNVTALAIFLSAAAGLQAQARRTPWNQDEEDDSPFPPRIAFNSLPILK